MDRRVGGRMSGDHRGARPRDAGWTSTASDHTSRATTSAGSTGTPPPGRLVPHVREDVPDRQLTAWLLLDHSPSMHFGTARPAQGGRRRGRGARRRPVRGPPRQPARDRHLRGRPRTASCHRPVAAAGCSASSAHSTPRSPRRVTARPRRPGRSPLVGATRTPAGRGRHRLRLPRSARLAARPHRTSPGRHAVIALEITDPREDALVDVGELTLIDPETGRTLRVDTGDRRLRSAFDEAAAAERASLATSFTRLGVRHLRLSTDGPWLPALARGFTGPPTEQDDPHDLPRARAAARPPPRPDRDRLLPVGPAPPEPLRRSVHQPRPPREPRTAAAVLAPPSAARPLSRGDRGPAHRPGPADDGRRRPARGRDRHPHDGRLRLDEGHRRRRRHDSMPPGSPPRTSSTSCPPSSASGSWRSPRSR